LGAFFKLFILKKFFIAFFYKKKYSFLRIVKIIYIFKQKKEAKGRRMKMEFERLKEIIVDTLACDEDKVTLDADMEKDLEIDSLSLVELHMALEDELSETIPDGEIGKLHTVKDILDYINGLKK